MLPMTTLYYTLAVGSIQMKINVNMCLVISGSDVTVDCEFCTYMLSSITVTMVTQLQT